MKYSLLTFLTLAIAFTTNAQRFKAGLSAGIDVSRMTFNEANGTPLTNKNKLAGGVFVEAGLYKLLSLQLEANYSSQGNAAIDGQNSLSLDFNYITIPVLVKLYGTKGLSFIAGGQIGILLDAKMTLNDNPTTDYRPKLKSNDFYAVFGVEYRFLNGVFIGSRYHAGQTNIALPPSPQFHNRYLNFRIGYCFMRKK